DANLDLAMQQAQPAIYQQIAAEPQTFPVIRGLGIGPATVGLYRPLDKARQDALPPAERALAEAVVGEHKQKTLMQFAYLPMVMAVAYVLLLLYYRSQGGYKAQTLGGGGGH